MKLATLKDGARDGQLVVVSRDLTRCLRSENPQTMQAAMDNWMSAAPELARLSDRLHSDTEVGATFDPKQCEAPLPRAYQWADASAFVNHMELVRKARGAEMPPEFWTDPLMYQGASDDFIGPCDPIELASENWGIDFESEVAVITGDVPMGSNPEECEPHIRLLMLVNDVSLRGLVPRELAKGFGFFQSKPATAFSPVALTPDELGEVWQDGKVHLPLETRLNGKVFGQPNAGVDMTFNFFQLVAHAVKSRNLRAGAIVGSGTVSNADRSVGSSCLAERRMLETISDGKPTTPFMSFGDRVRIEMFNESGSSLFGAIDQQVQPYRK